jgi:sulfur carrier protein ThiS
VIAVSVRLLGDVRRFVRESPDGLTRRIPEGATIADLLGALGIPLDEELVIGINNSLAGRETTLAAGDSVLLVTPMAGG